MIWKWETSFKISSGKKMYKIWSIISKKLLNKDKLNKNCYKCKCKINIKMGINILAMVKIILIIFLGEEEAINNN